MMKRVSILIVFGLISLAQWDVIRDCVLSFIFYLIVSAQDLSLTRFWNADLFELWLAGCVWLLTGAVLALNLVDSLRQREWRWFPSTLPGNIASRPLAKAGSLVVVLATYVSLTCPILASFDPNVQGDLVATRLLPPMSVIDVAFRSLPDNEKPEIAELFKATNQRLLTRDRMVRVPENVDGVTRESSTVWFVLGTDALGRDVLSRVVYGTRVSFGIGLAAAIGALLAGLCSGLASGIAGRRLDALIMRCTDLLLCIPQLFLVLAVVAVFGRSVMALVLALALTGWMSIARVVRDEVRRLRNAEFILAARMLGVHPVKIVVRHFLPNIRPVLVTAGVLQFANVVLAEAALGFLGLGIQPPTPTWGNMMGEATAYLGTAWWLAFFPGFSLSILVISIHCIGEVYSRGTETEIVMAHGRS